MALDDSQDMRSGILEIAPLTVLIGATTAQSLILGSKGAAGLPWAAMSSFGSIFLAKACIAASTPAWLRDTLGVRNSYSDAAVGVSLDLRRKKRGMVMNSSGAIGVQVRWKDDGSPEPHSSASEGIEDVYVFDEYTAAAVRSCTMSDNKRALKPHTYARDIHWARVSQSQARIDWMVILASGIKLVEAYALWYTQAKHLWWLTLINWSFFFACASIIQLAGYGRERDDREGRSYLDVLTGKMPTPQVIGDEARAILGVPANVRKSYLWRVSWALGSLVCAGSTVASYVTLVKETPRCVYLWLGFQCMWLFARSIYFHLGANTDDMKHAFTPVARGATSAANLNYRLVILATALSRYQVLHHPRGSYSYEEDTSEAPKVKKVLREAAYSLRDNYPYPVSVADEKECDVLVEAVFGDTLLSSLSWIGGLGLTGMDLYDSCLVALRVSGQLILVPSVRVLSGKAPSMIPKDIEESTAPVFVDKGGSNDGTNLAWVYWIPCGDSSWLTFSTGYTETYGQAMPVVGRRTMKVSSDAAVDELLKSGSLAIGLTEVSEVKQAQKQSAVVGKFLCGMLKDVE